ncbi:MAG: hypothetical protein U0031_11110 [Thermomicrobiales bacterium]
MAPAITMFNEQSCSADSDRALACGIAKGGEALLQPLAIGHLQRFPVTELPGQERRADARR